MDLVNGEVTLAERGLCHDCMEGPCSRGCVLSGYQQIEVASEVTLSRVLDEAALDEVQAAQQAAAVDMYLQRYRF